MPHTSFMHLSPLGVAQNKQYLAYANDWLSSRLQYEQRCPLDIYGECFSIQAALSSPMFKQCFLLQLSFFPNRALEVAPQYKSHWCRYLETQATSSELLFLTPTLSFVQSPLERIHAIQILSYLHKTDTLNSKWIGSTIPMNGFSLHLAQRSRS